MKIEFSTDKVKLQCTSVKAANKLFGGDQTLIRSLMARINALRSTENLRDIIVQKAFRFHSLKGNLVGYFVIDVKTIKEPWRIILQPLNEDNQPYIPCNIDEISNIVEIVEIKEVSKHYD